MSEDPRQQQIVAPIKVEQHKYEVRWHDPDNDSGSFITSIRHVALQQYVAKRKELNDWTDKPAEYIVRMFCDNKEYFNDQEIYPVGPKQGSGKSCRQLNGAVRPYPWERHLP